MGHGAPMIGGLRNESSMKREPLGIAVVGVGYWGPNLVRTFAQCPGVEVRVVCDRSPERLRAMKRLYPGVKIVPDVEGIVNDPSVDAVALALPPSMNFEVGSCILEAGKHLFVEKPLSLSTEAAQGLIDVAERARRILMVGHTFIFNAAVRQIKRLLLEGFLGTIHYIHCQRLNLGRVREDLDCLWTLAPHDVSIALYWLDEMPISVSAKGFSYLRPEVCDVVFLTLEFPGGVDTQIFVSWLNPNKIRRINIVGSEKMIVYDDVSVDAKIQIYDKGVQRVAGESDHGSFGEFQHQIRQGDLLIPHIEFAEPLKVECQHFIECIVAGKAPITDGEAGLRVVRVLEAASKSLREAGRPVALEAGRSL